MDVFRFVKRAMKSNDPTRRYMLVTGDGTRAGDIEVIPPAHGTVRLDVVLRPVLSDAAREDALNTTRRFLDELAGGWGVQLDEGSGTSGLAEQPDGNYRVQIEYRVI
ncbi:unnamed protein product [Gemmata massiliana]|uniref:Uncharacterized protein n=1 Tax=Gemmata massiliana TaxID=1210884 RepID=A0A6P2D4U7_9BACT|nr:hypothetical protein [Gemmata massiliana]VTR96318.1 unnamed protein product [Gemmata massiliana]